MKLEQLRLELERLREENRRLREELSSIQGKSGQQAEASFPESAVAGAVSKNSRVEEKSQLLVLFVA